MQLGRNQEEAFFLLKAMLVSPDFLYIREKNQNRRGLTALKLPTVCPIFCGLPFPTMIFLFWQRMKNCRIGKSSSNRQFDYSMMIAIGRLWKALLIAGYLDKLGTMPPASLKFREYYRYGLKDAMLEETYHFVSNAIDKNVPVTDFIQSDYTFINQDLARHYKMEGIEGIHFRKVSLPSESMRGGLLGQASIDTYRQWR